MQRRKATRQFWAWLGLATALMLAGLLVLMGIFLRQAKLAEEAAQLQADSVTALVFQLEREFLRLRSAVELAGAADVGATDWDALALRYDIFLSRLNLLLTSPSVDRLHGTDEYQTAVPHLQQVAAQIDPWMADPAAHRAQWRAMGKEMGSVAPEVQALSFAANSMISRQMEQQIRTLRGQGRLIVGLFAAQALLLLSVAAAIILRQRRQERERLALEQLNRDLEAARQLAEQANVTKSHFLANMSHELRTPFNGMLGMLQLLHETPLDARQRDYLQTAGDSAQHLLTLLNDILDVAAIEEGKLKVAPEAIDLPRVLRDVVTPMAAQAHDKGLRFEVRLAPNLPEAVRLDPTRTRQVLFNLLSNAIKFTERGGVDFEVQVQPGPDDARVALVFTIRDTGIGMSAESVGRLFERFYQVDSRLSRRRSGSGLGLNISRALAELMGGALKVESREGQGSTFTLQLPTTIEASATSGFAHTTPPPLPVAAPVPAPATAPPAPAPDHRASAEPAPASPQTGDGMAPEATLRVLVVDDHPVNLKLASAMLQRMGHEVVQASNGREALAQVSAQTLDLVLMDLHMPEMDGLESIQHIRQLPLPLGQVPVVVLTANALEQARQDAERVGANGFLTKPLKLKELQAVVRDCQATLFRQQRPATTAQAPAA